MNEQLTEKNAVCIVKLTADSGYEAELKGRISPLQWGEIVKIIQDDQEATS